MVILNWCFLFLVWLVFVNKDLFGCVIVLNWCFLCLLLCLIIVDLLDLVSYVVDEFWC